MIHSRQLLYLIYCVVCNVLISNIIQAQESQEKLKKSKQLLEIDFEPDSNYIEKYFEKVNFAFELEQRNFDLILNNPLREAFGLIYRPYLPGNFGLALDYSWLSIYINLRTLQSEQGIQRKGETRQFAFRFGINRRAVWSNIFFLHSRGLYLQNPNLVDPLWDVAAMGYPKRPDLDKFTFFANSTYAFNAKRFSYRAALWQGELQKKSAGSPIIGLFMRYNGFQSRSGQSLLPEEISYLYPSNADLIAFRGFNIGVNVGYAYTFVFLDHLFMTISVWPGLSAQNGAFTLENQNARRAGFEWNSQADARFIIGFNHPAFYFGYSAQSISFSGADNFAGIIQNTYSWNRIFFGIRATAPNSMRKTFKMVEDRYFP